MKDPKYAEDSSDPEYADDSSSQYFDIELALRIRLQATNKQFQTAIENFEDGEQGSRSHAGSVRCNIRFSRASATNVRTLRSLPPTTNILLFTPVIVPAGHPAARDPLVVQQAIESQRNIDAKRQKLGLHPREETVGSFDVEAEAENLVLRSGIETIDPFEAFGRALSSFHKRIRHVPYVAHLEAGFTETHRAFISQADAVITVVCEPDIDKDRSVSSQMNFAENVLDALEEHKDATVANALVLVQCGANQYRLPVDATFMNVIECQNYNDEVAQSIARTIFEARV